MTRSLLRAPGTVVAAVIVVCALTTGLIVSTVSTVQARRARDAAHFAENQARATVAYLRKVLASVDPGVDGRQIRVIDLLTKASEMIAEDLADQPEVEAAVRKTIGLALLELGLFEDAGAELDRTVAIQREVLGPDDPETLCRRAEALMELGELDHALDDLERAVALSPDDRQARLMRAEARYEEGDFEEALKDYARLVDLDQTDADARYGRGWTYLELLRSAEALEDFVVRLRLQA